MSKRILFILFSALFLLVGATIYVLLRPNTYIAQFIGNLIGLNPLGEVGCNFLKFYLPDFLWAISLCFALYAIYLPNPKTSIILSVVVFVCGVVWEALQWAGVLGGTGDLLDVIMYLVASMLAVTFNLKKEKTK
ncbi:MAG: hypothetical protein E7531_01125 [Ruminococcaceae bacterium]|nr:hypothetical protein [Oscillospiraceae bacterium]